MIRKNLWLLGVGMLAIGFWTWHPLAFVGLGVMVLDLVLLK